MSVAGVTATRVVMKYISELEREPRIVDYWNSEYFAQRSYARTAAYEILDLLRNSSEPPLVVIEDYKDKMNEYACTSTFASVMFSVAHDTAEGIIDALISSYY